jgi:putative peptidoglycan lipid II flippase
MSIGRTSLLLAPLVLAARAVAFFVPLFIARWYGVQSATDAYYWALSIPTLLLILGGTTMGTVLVPVLARLRAGAPHEVDDFVGAAVTFAAGAATSCGAAFALVAPFVLPRVTNFDADTRALTVVFAWALVPFLATMAASAVLKATCEVHGHFAGPAAAPVLRAVTTLSVVWVARPHGPLALPGGVLAGSIVETLWLLTILRSAGIRPRPNLTFHPALGEAARAFAAVLGGETMVAMNLIVDKVFAGGGHEGSVTLLEYADHARAIPQTLLESSLLVVAFNAWAVARARGEDEARRRAVATTLWWVCLLAPPVLGGMFIGRVALVRMLYEHGAFAPEHSAVVAAVLAGFLPGVLMSLLGALIVKAHIVDGRYGLVLRLGLLSFALNAALDAVMMPTYGLVGLAVSTSVTTAVVTIVSFSRLLPSLVGSFPARATRDAGLLVAGSVAITGLGIALAFAPVSVADPALWIAAVPFLGLLGAGAARARRAP